MPSTTLAGKMKLRAHQRAAIINAPDGYRKTLGPLPPGVHLVAALEGRFDWVQIFVRSEAEVKKLAPPAVTLRPCRSGEKRQAFR